MNRSGAYAEKRLEGFVGWFCLAWKAQSFPVKTKRDGKIIYFPDKDSAELAAWRVKHKIEEPHYRRDGEKLLSNQPEIDKVFSKWAEERSWV